MPTSTKTTNLGLNSWLSTDKPKREDFVNDNNIIDNTVSSHIADMLVHLSSEDRELFTNPFYYDILAGDGEESRTFVLDFQPKFILVFLRDTPLISYDPVNQCTVCNYGIAVPTYGATEGVVLRKDELTLSQSQSYPESGGTYINLNSTDGQYVLIALR